MAILINQTSNLRLRLDLTHRLSDGVLAPASLRMAVAVERYEHAPAGTRREHGYAPLVRVAAATLLDLDLINFLHALEDLIGRAPVPDAAGSERKDALAKDMPAPEAALEASVDPAIGLRVIGGPEAYQIEIGIDLLNLLEPVGGQAGERGADLALFRFFANARAVVSFCAALIAEYQNYPTDPSRVAPGEAG